jgi:serine-type D-Ala-D-Ala carboxypeptidase/endopeptidase (penicillin-binding protein 4)
MRKILYLFVIIFIGCSCTSITKFTKRQLSQSEVFSQNFTGFSLFDLAQNRIIFEQNADKYFMPASNTKLFSFYAGLKCLGDSIPALKYVVRNDSLIFWGTGDPSFLHPDLKSTKVYDFLKNRKEKLFYANTNNSQKINGNGWMIDDYNDNYQAEINLLPVFGNIVRFIVENNKLQASPLKIVNEIAPNNKGYVIRDISRNEFSLPNNSLKPDFEQDVPFKVSSENTIFLLTDTLKRKVEIIDLQMPKEYNTIFSIKSDSLYKRMLYVSDNMLAEQLILLCSNSDSLSTQNSIENILKTHLAELPDQPRWVDGSGLSRYNLFTPRDIVAVLQKINATIPEGRLFTLLPSIHKTEKPFIYAKSGSFSNNYNLSGFLIGQSGKRYIFSFMNNSYMKPTSQIRKEVVRILTEMHMKL